jgi:hypothetical protein
MVRLLSPHKRYCAARSSSVTRVTADGAMAETVLRDEKREMHTREIAERIFQQFGVRVKPTSLGSQLWRATRRPNSPFCRSKNRKNTYGHN